MLPLGVYVVKKIIRCFFTIFFAGALLASCKVEVMDPPGSLSQLRAAAGSNLRVNVGSLVTLDGSGSTQALSYSWTMSAQPANSTAALSGASTAYPMFIPDVVGQYGIQLIVSDGQNYSYPSTVLVNALDTSPACTTDDVTGLPASGYLLTGPAEDFAPLCSGLILLEDRTANNVRKLDILNGTINTYQLTSAPSDVELDAQNGFLYAAQPSGTSVARINLLNDTTSEIALSAGSLYLAVGNNGDLFASLQSASYDHPVALVNGPNLTVEKVFPSVFGTSYYEMIAYDKVGNQLITADVGVSPSSLARYAFDPSARTLTLTEDLWDAGGNAQDLVISPNGAHIAFSDGAGNGTPNYTIWDFDSTDLNNHFGEWDTNAYPTSADFDPTGRYLVATNGFSIQVFSASTYEKLSEYSLDFSFCDYSSVEKVRFSRGGRIIYLLASCGFSKDSGKLFWIVYQ